MKNADTAMCRNLGLFFTTMLLALPARAQLNAKPSGGPLLDSGQLTRSLFQGAWEAFWMQRPFWLVLLAILLIKGVLRYFQRKALSKSGIAEIDRMDGLTFEKYLETLFARLGYTVERMPYAGDWGADLVTRKDGVKTVIQAKRSQNTVGVRAIASNQAWAGERSRLRQP